MVMLTAWAPNHMQITEPYSVAAFIGAIEQHKGSKPWVLDIGANVGAYTVIGALLGAHVLAVDLQPTCAALVRCHLSLNNFTTSAEVFNAYASPDHINGMLSVPMTDCVKTASPTAVVGRFPTGFLSKKTRHAHLLPPSQLRQVPPLHVARLLSDRLSAGSNLTATKIDVEGYEIQVLEALRPVWTRLGDVIRHPEDGVAKPDRVTLREAGVDVRD